MRVLPALCDDPSNDFLRFRQDCQRVYVVLDSVLRFNASGLLPRYVLGQQPLLQANASATNGSVTRINITRVREGLGLAVPVRVTLNGAQLTESAVPFSYYAHPSIVSVQPPLGTASGGTVVTLGLYANASDYASMLTPTSLRYGNSTEPYCRFGSVAVPAVVDEANQTLRCVTPRHAPGSALVTVGFNGQQFSPAPSAGTFIFLHLSELVRVSPRSGPLDGGTRVSVIGLNLSAPLGVPNAAAYVYCRFSHVPTVVAALDVTPQSVVCVAPPGAAPGPVQLDVTLNGADYTAVGVQYTYELPARIDSLLPASGPSDGGNVVALRGFGFQNVDSSTLAGGLGELVRYTKRASATLGDLRCSIGGVQTYGWYAAPGEVRCVVPPLLGQSEVQQIVIPTAGVNSSALRALVVTLSLTKPCVANWAEGVSGSAISRILPRAPGFADVCVPTEEVHLPLLASADAVTGAVSAFHGLIAPVVSVDVNSTAAAVVWTVMLSAYDGDVPQLSGVVTFPAPLNVSANDTTLSVPVSVATVQNGTSASAAAAAGPLGVPVRVTFNGQDFTGPEAPIYTYYASPRVLSLGPHHGPLRGGTLVDVRGSGFLNTSTAFCLFGEPLVDGAVVSGASGWLAVPVAEYVSSSLLRCRSPPSLRPGPVPVRISLNGHSEWSNASAWSYASGDGASFTYDEDVVITALEPPLGSTAGGSIVRLVGSGFLPTSELACRFGAVAVSATWVADGTATCVTPPHAQGLVPVEVSVNGQDFTQLDSPYYFHEQLSLSELVPRLGPARSAGTLVRVFGSGFVNTSLLSCRFGAVAVPAVYVSATQVRCAAPPVDVAMHYQPLTAHNTTVAASQAAAIERVFPGAHIYPHVWSRLLAVDVSNNAQDYTDSGLRWLSTADAAVLRVYPASARQTATVPLFVYGTNFVNTSALRCRIGTATVAGKYISPSLVACFTPQRAATQPGPRYGDGDVLRDGARTEPGGAASPGRVYVEVANNGLDFTSDRVTFEYMGPCPTGSWCPAREASATYPCPRGAYCPGTGNANFTLCPQGTYQPVTGKSACLRCPIGYACPDVGMYVPRLCPAGFVCDVPGIERPEQPCPEGHVCLEGTATTATTCGDPRVPSPRLVPTAGHAEMTTTLRLGREPRQASMVLGARRAACWDNSTADFGLQASAYPARFWAEAHALPLSPSSPFKPLRGRYCLDDSCMRLADEGDLRVESDGVFAYESQGYALRRPVPCPAGMYCGPGSAVTEAQLWNYTTPQPCAESFYCPEGSVSHRGFGGVPAGFYAVDGVKVACPPGTACPYAGTRDPLPCPPGTFNGMVGQRTCTPCPPGYLCPGFGRIDPAICPPGFVCSRAGLASPNVLCPAGFFCPNGTRTSDPFRNDTTLRPYPCRPGTYCLAGTGYDRVRPATPGYAQNCTAGFYCELGSASPIGSGLCPRGFECPPGTAAPIPTRPGYFAEHEGTVAAAPCLPGTYAPTIQTITCYPCPPGAACESDGTAEVTTCGPGTYRSLAETDGVVCTKCSQGTWSKQWELRDSAECMACPPGTVCPVDGASFPCSNTDLPSLWTQVTEETLDWFNCNARPLHRYGMLADPKDPFDITRTIIDPVAGPVTRITRYWKGAFLTPDPDGVTFTNGTLAVGCYYNPQPGGSVVYQRLRDYHGPLHEMIRGVKHQGYGNDTYQGYFNTGSRAINLHSAPVFDPANNCTSGYWSAAGVVGGPSTWRPGTCEADVICQAPEKTQARACAEGFVCPEGTTALTASSHPCPGGYVCDFGTTPDYSLQAPQGQYKLLCAAGYYCLERTGITQMFRSVCPAGYFCTSGAFDPPLGRVSDDALHRHLSAGDANPYVPILRVATNLTGVRLPYLVSRHDQRCFDGINPALMGQYRTYQDARGRTARIDLAIEQDSLCARDHKWRLIADTIRREECNCVAQLSLVQELWRLWKCTEAAPASSACVFSGNRNRLPGPDSWSAPSASALWNRTRVAPFGFPMLNRGIQLPHVPLLAARYWRACEPQVFPSTSMVIGPWLGGALVGDCTLRGPLPAVGAACPVWCGFRELKAWVEAAFVAEVDRTSRPKLNDAPDSRMDPLVFDLKHAVDLLDTVANYSRADGLDDDNFAYGGDDSAFWDAFDFHPNATGLIPLRLDACECESALRCPNGTISAPGSHSVYDCVKHDDEVLRRLSPLPPSHPRVSNHSTDQRLRDLYEDRGGVGVLNLRGLEQAVITMNMTALPVNLTYDHHYQLAVYAECRPCPPRYVCQLQYDPPNCTYPSLAQQAGFGYACEDCCRCQSMRLPSWFAAGANKEVSPYMDNKHAMVTLTLTALRDTWVFVAFELLHGLYYPDFEADLRGITTLHVQGPSRAAYSLAQGESDATFGNRQGFFAFIRQSNMASLALPLNMPVTQQRSIGTVKQVDKVFVNDVLIDRPPDVTVADPWHPSLVAAQAPRTARRLLQTAGVTSSPRSPAMSEAHAATLVQQLASIEARLNSTSWSRWSFTPSTRWLWAVLDNRFYHASARTFADDHAPAVRRLTGALTTAETAALCTTSAGTGVPACLCLTDRPYFESNRQCASRIGLGLVCIVNETQALCGRRVLNEAAYWQRNLNRLVRPAVDVVRDPDAETAVDLTWWNIGDSTGGEARPFTSLGLPYFPWFSNCDGYDSHMPVFKLLEQHPDCQRVPYEQTVAVEAYPWLNRLYPTSDRCEDRSWVRNPPLEVKRPGVPVWCTYDEDVFSPPTQSRWFETFPGEVLWYMNREPMGYEEFRGDYGPNPGTDPRTTSLWGRSWAFTSLVGTEKLIPVRVVAGDMERRATMVPRLVNFTLQYYQVDKGHKRLVRGSVSFGDYCTTSKHPGVIAELGALGVPQCKEGDFGYLLRFTFSPMWWLDLLNYFQFDAGIYIVMYLLIGLVVMIVGVAVYIAHRLLTRLRRPPQFRFMETWKLVNPAPAIGAALVIAPAMLMLLAIISWWVLTGSKDPVDNPSPHNFEGYSGSWLDTAVLDLPRITEYRIGRVGASVLFAGVFTVFASSRLFNPRGAGGKYELTDFATAADEGESAADLFGLPESEPNPFLHETWTPLRWKRAHMVVLSLGVAFTLVLWTEFSYSDVFANQQIFIIIAFKLVSLVVDLFLRTVLKDVLTVAPLIVVIHLIGFLVLAGANTFTDYITAFCVQLIMTALNRVYLEPTIKSIHCHMPLWALRAKRWLTSRRRKTREQRLAEEQEWRRVNEEVTLQTEGVEPLLESCMLFSTEVVAVLLQPFLQLTVYVLDASPMHGLPITRIPALQNIEATDLVYFTVLSIIIIPFHLACDVFLLHAQELAHGWKLHDYLAFQRYRFSQRDTRWQVEGHRVDASLGDSLQRLDMMCFSSQYYFLLALHSWGLVLTILGSIIMLHHGYNMFGDWVTLVNLLLTWTACTVFQWLMVAAGDAAGLWRRKTVESTVEDERAAKLAIGESNAESLEGQRLELAALNSERFRQRFFDRNRPWLIAHLVELLTPRTLGLPDAQGVSTAEYLRGIHAQLSGVSAVARGRFRGEDAVYDFGDDGGAGSAGSAGGDAGGGFPAAGGSSLPAALADGVSPMQQAAIADRVAPTVTTQTLGRWWLDAARRRLQYRTSVAGFMEVSRKARCQGCDSGEGPGQALRVVLAGPGGQPDPTAFDALVRAFEAQEGIEAAAADGAAIDMVAVVPAWKAFYRARAQPYTRCDSCERAGRLNAEAARQRAKYGEEARWAAAAVEAAQHRVRDESRATTTPDAGDAGFEPMAVDRDGALGRAVGKWLSAARTRLGGDFPRPEARDEMEAYARLLRAARDRRLAAAATRGAPAAAPAPQRLAVTNLTVEPTLPGSAAAPELSPVAVAVAQRWIGTSREGPAPGT